MISAVCTMCSGGIRESGVEIRKRQGNSRCYYAVLFQKEYSNVLVYYFVVNINRKKCIKQFQGSMEE